MAKSRRADVGPLIRGLASQPLLTAEEEIELANRRDGGDQSAVGELVSRNQRLVILIAGDYQGRWVDFDDMVSAGQFGLMHAARKFNPSKGARFSTYATPWIRQAIGRHIANTSHPIRIPLYIQEVVATASRHNLTIGETIKRQLKERKYKQPIRYAPDAVRAMKAKVGNVDDAHPPFTVDRCRAEDEEASAAVAAALDSLPEFHAKVIRLHYGMVGAGPIPVALIAKLSGVPRHDVTKAKVEALAKLRNALRDAV